MRGWLDRVRSRLGAPVVRIQGRTRVRIEGEDRSSRFAVAERVAVVAHWDRTPRASRSVSALLAALVESGFETVLVSAAEGRAPLAWVAGRPDGVTVLRRPNLGYDFGSWATALHRWPTLRTRPAVLLVNDSLVGPFSDARPVFGAFLDSGARFWGVTDSREIHPHVQSYCLGFKGGVLEEPALVRFWGGIRDLESKTDIVDEYEIGLSRLVQELGLPTEVLHPGLVDGAENPTLRGWRTLLDAGVPFVKRTVLKQVDVWDPQGTLGPVVRERFGEELATWL